MARWTAKEIVLTISSTKEAIIFLDAIQKQIKIVDILADYYPGKVTIRFEGSKENLKSAIDTAKKIHLMVSEMLYPDNGDRYNYNLEFISKITGKTVPIKTLIRILNLKDYKTTRVDGVITSKIDFETLKKLIEKIRLTISEMPYEVTTTSLKDVLATIVIMKEETIEKTITRAKKAKIIKEDDLNRLQLAMEAEQAIETCLKKA